MQSTNLGKLWRNWSFIRADIVGILKGEIRVNSPARQFAMRWALPCMGLEKKELQAPIPLKKNKPEPNNEG
ncbi:MAG: hypothetical protein ACR2PS_19085 [Pseudomonadales bacterium]